MKRLTRTALALAAAGLTAAAADRLAPAATDRLALDAHRLLTAAAAGVETNPVPSLVAMATLLASVALRATRGKPAAAKLPAAPPPEAGEAAVLRRALARATRTQLVADQIALEHRRKALPEAVRKAERDACYTENAAAEAERSLEVKQEAHAEAVDRLDALRHEQSTAAAEADAIRAELAKLAGRV